MRGEVEGLHRLRTAGHEKPQEVVLVIGDQQTSLADPLARGRIAHGRERPVRFDLEGLGDIVRGQAQQLAYQQEQSRAI